VLVVILSFYAVGNISYDLVVMATHGRGGLQRWLLGSVTERLLEQSSLPALIVRPTERVTKEPEVLQQERVLQSVGLD